MVFGKIMGRRTECVEKKVNKTGKSLKESGGEDAGTIIGC